MMFLTMVVTAVLCMVMGLEKLMVLRMTWKVELMKITQSG